MPGPCSTFGPSAESLTPFQIPKDLTTGNYLPLDVKNGLEDLTHLVSELSTAFTGERACGHRLDRYQDAASFDRLSCKIGALLQAYSRANSSDWRRYAAWSAHGYTRHLLFDTEEFELMVICWKAGQTSRIHNHADSHCWLTVLEGNVREVRYRPGPLDTEVTPPRAEGAEAAPARLVDLEPTAVADLQVGDVAYINDGIALHSVGCPRATVPDMAAGGDAFEDTAGGCVALQPQDSGVACTLHLYCPPIRRVKAVEEGRVVECVPGFFSRHSVCGASGHEEKCQ